LEHTLETYVHSYCNMCNIPISFCNFPIYFYNIQIYFCNIPIYFCNTDRNTCNVPLKYLKHLKHILATRAFERNISLLQHALSSATSPYCLGMEPRQRVEFTGVELTTSMEKVVTCLVEKGRRWLTSGRRREEEEETPRRGSRKRGERCNTRSTFEILRCNTCNIRLKVDGTLETCI
jgi:hypothetical protein